MLIFHKIRLYIKIIYNDRQFYRELELQGYEIKISEKNISVKHPMHQRFVRLKSLGREYEKVPSLNEVELTKK